MLSSHRRMQTACATQSTVTHEDVSSGALTQIGRLLQRENYGFTAVTPETYRRNRARGRSAVEPTRTAQLRNAFGWNRPFQPAELPSKYIELLEEASALQ